MGHRRHRRSQVIELGANDGHIRQMQLAKGSRAGRAWSAAGQLVPFLLSQVFTSHRVPTGFGRVYCWPEPVLLYLRHTIVRHVRIVFPWTHSYNICGTKTIKMTTGGKSTCLSVAVEDAMPQCLACAYAYAHEHEHGRLCASVCVCGRKGAPGLPDVRTHTRMSLGRGDLHVRGQGRPPAVPGVRARAWVPVGPVDYPLRGHERSPGVRARARVPVGRVHGHVRGK